MVMLTFIFIYVFRGIVISLEDGTLKFLSLSRIANDVPVTGRPFVGTKTKGVSTYQLSEYLIWSVHASEITGTSHLMSNHVDTKDWNLNYSHMTIQSPAIILHNLLYQLQLL
ncbi:hypothetical protein E2562_027444 [Oryza meyeriana var. granulata]|uniref:Legume lectin domain-containing protein n=1 Tax=Oryza meyeriana var. granulata TaxID=110450 RepID=A0A6G1CIW8_9ORYZ|nr:hypothetical protein E2562_027444 [Oryza meyeriana var. granulata]